MTSSVRSWINQHRLLSFIAITYGFSWSVQGVLIASGLEASWTQSILIKQMWRPALFELLNPQSQLLVVQ